MPTDYLHNHKQFPDLIRIYTTATLMTSPRTAAATGEFADLSEMTSLKTFITSFAGHIAAEAAR
jgi:hypothetical protein